MAKKKISHVVTDPAELAKIEQKKDELKQKRKAKQEANTKSNKTQTILEFVGQYSVNDYGVIKATVPFVKGGARGLESIAEKDRNTINSYLNTGYALYASRVNAGNVREHRARRSEKLLTTLEQLFSPEQLYHLSKALPVLVNRDTEVNELVKKRTAMTNAIPED